MVVVVIHNLKSQRASVSRTLVFAYEILLLWIYVGIAVENHRCDAMFHQTLHYCRGAWGATGMQQHLLHSSGHIQFQPRVGGDAFDRLVAFYIHVLVHSLT